MKSNAPCQLVSIVVCLLALPQAASAWSDKGHRITAQVAENTLTPKTRQALDAFIGTRQLAQLATWPDYIRSGTGWGFASTWHWITVEDERQLSGVLERSAETVLPDNVVEATNFLTAVLRGEEAETEAFAALMAENGAEPLAGSVKATALAFITHFIGDMHQPMHVGRGGDRGGNSITVNWFDEQMNLHALWDRGLIDRESLSYTEFTAFLEQEFAARAAAWSGGEPADWAAESRALRYEVYEIWQRTDRENHLPDLGFQYSHDHIGTVKQRLFQGGVRLGALLNEIFD